MKSRFGFRTTSLNFDRYGYPSSVCYVWSLPCLNQHLVSVWYVSEEQNVYLCGEEMFEHERKKNRSTSGRGARGSHLTIQPRTSARASLLDSVGSSLLSDSYPPGVSSEGDKCRRLDHMRQIPFIFFLGKPKTKTLFTIKTRAVYIFRSTRNSRETQTRSRQLPARAWGPNIRVHEQSKFSEEIPGLRKPRTAHGEIVSRT